MEGSKEGNQMGLSREKSVGPGRRIHAMKWQRKLLGQLERWVLSFP